MNIEISDEFDWVGARAECTPTTAIKALASQVRLDVDKRNQLRSVYEVQYQAMFIFSVGANDSFHVSLMFGQDRPGIASFSKAEDGIVVSYKIAATRAGTHSWADIHAVLTLGNDGKCRLKPEGEEELTFWQFRRRVLEPIFFSLSGGLLGL